MNPVQLDFRQTPYRGMVSTQILLHILCLQRIHIPQVISSNQSFYIVMPISPWGDAHHTWVMHITRCKFAQRTMDMDQSYKPWLVQQLCKVTQRDSYMATYKAILTHRLTKRLLHSDLQSDSYIPTYKAILTWRFT